jgi:hypothetical protein
MEIKQQFNAFIIGAQKAASSSLHFSLLSHPQVASKRDEITVFEDPFYSMDSVGRELREHVEMNPNARAVMLKRPNLLCDPLAPQRLFQHNSDGRLICIFRDPSARAVSAIIHYMKSGLLPVCSVDEAIQRIFVNEEQNLTEVEYTIREYGFYGKYIEGWLSAFKADQFLFLKQGELRDLETCYRKVCSFLGIEDTLSLPPMNDSKTKATINSMSRLRLHHGIWRVLRKNVAGSIFTKWRRPVVFFRAMAHLFTIVDRSLLANWCSPSTELKASTEKLQFLRVFYAQDVALCASRTGLDLRDWKPCKSPSSGEGS